LASKNSGGKRKLEGGEEKQGKWKEVKWRGKQHKNEFNMTNLDQPSK